MRSARLNNTHRSPSAVRTLIEIQKYFESPALNKEESFLVNEKVEKIERSFQSFQEINDIQSIQKFQDPDSHSIAPKKLRNTVETLHDHLNFNNTSNSNLDQTLNLPELKNINEMVSPPNATRMSRNHMASSTFHNSQSALRLRGNKTQNPYTKRSDQIENDAKFMRSLREADMLHLPTSRKPNPY